MEVVVAEQYLSIVLLVRALRTCPSHLARRVVALCDLLQPRQLSTIHHDDEPSSWDGPRQSPVCTTLDFSQSLFQRSSVDFYCATLPVQQPTMTLQKDIHPILRDTPSIPSQRVTQTQAVARSSPRNRRNPTEVLTRADDSEKYETSWSSAGASQTGRYASTVQSKFGHQLDLITVADIRLDAGSYMTSPHISLPNQETSRSRQQAALQTPHPSL